MSDRLRVLIVDDHQLVLAGERIYRRALMQTGGKLSLKEAWRLEE